MIEFAIAVLGLMTVANYWVGRRFLYPPVVFCFVWTVDLLLVRLAGSFFYPIADKTLVIFCLGALSISAGSAIGLLVPQRTAQQERSASTKVIDVILNCLFLLVVCSSPFVVLWIADLASNFDAATFLLAARMAMVDAYQSGDSSTSLYGNIVTLSIIIAMIAFLQNEGRKMRASIAIAIAFLLNIAGGSRAQIIFLTVALICIDWIKKGRIRWKLIVSIFIVLCLILSWMAIAIQKGEARADASLAENFIPVFDGFVLYLGGGIAAFDRVVRDPNIIPHEWQITGPILLIANKLGGHFAATTTYAEFVDVGPGAVTQNVYTVYFAYIDLGSVGMVLCIALYGFVVTLFYRRAIAGYNVSILMYSFFFATLLLTPFAEFFFMGLNFSVKLLVVAWIVYEGPTRVAEMAAYLGRVAPERAHRY